MKFLKAFWLLWVVAVSVVFGVFIGRHTPWNWDFKTREHVFDTNAPSTGSIANSDLTFTFPEPTVDEYSIYTNAYKHELHVQLRDGGWITIDRRFGSKPTELNPRLIQYGHYTYNSDIQMALPDGSYLLIRGPK